MFRHRIKDLMIVNAVLAVVLAAAIALKSFGAVLFIGIVVGTLVVLPLMWVESYLYHQQKGTWYRWRHPLAPRPRYVAGSDAGASHWRAPVDVAGRPIMEEPPAWPRSRTRLFESGGSSERVSRASILLKVASRLETSGRIGAAVSIYEQIVGEFAGTVEAKDAARRLQSLPAPTAWVDPASRRHKGKHQRTDWPDRSALDGS